MRELFATLYARGVALTAIQRYRIRAAELGLTVGELLTELAQFLPRVKRKKS